MGTIHVGFTPPGNDRMGTTYTFLIYASAATKTTPADTAPCSRGPMVL